ncbi:MULTISPECIES: ATP-binding protein [unclassified Thiobacillus]|uniref:sensor histidine kinase n=1 Tax=unclassified Thiobacillus TaxID=2646513 RepID=UPI00086CE37A|nr:MULTISPECIES: ATP-binding protein [unclassified Thiobacillus]ODV00087.1 MAG: two-component sensor histidine kinase [Thiobacillus sp. SCN 63-57]
MTIRKTLLIAFLSVGLLPAILLASLAFVKAREAVQAEIERNLAIQATGVAADIDKMMFERLQNAATWSHLDIMQDLQVRDVDKRLSHFLSDLHAGYKDVYLALACVDRDGRIISSSDAAEVGRQVTDRPVWLGAALSGADVALESPTGQEDGGLVMRVPVASAFAGGTLGQLRLKLDWTEIDDVLDQATSGGGRMLAVLDRDGRLIAASKELRTRGMLLGKALAAWRTAAAGPTVSVRPGAPVADSDVIVGAARAHGYANFAGFGWTTLIIQPVDQALAPVHRMALIFLGLLGLIMLLTFSMASWVSREIARPVAALTGFARGYMRNKILQAPPVARGGEVGELTDAFVQMMRDIDQSQQNLVRASKLAVVGEMSSVIAHEVRTPLGILRSSAQMLQRESGISEEGRELVGFIESETERLNRLVSAMLDTARPRAPSYAAVDMHALIEKSIAMLGAQAGKKQVSVTARLRATRPVIECDEEQITQVLLNLLMNGLQILDHGGQIELATHDDDAFLTIEMADDGPGIDPAERTRVFEAFFFKREGGIGLGLAIVQQIVGAHGGDIEAAESKLGGALFRIRLPRRQSGET